MEAKREIETKAKSLIDSAPAEAVKLYEQIWSELIDQFNAWDAFYYLKAMRKDVSINSMVLNELVEKFKDDEKVSGLYSWYIFDRYIKKADKNVLLSNENIIRSSFGICKQKDLSENHEFPCPYTITVFRLIDAHSENLFNANKIFDLLEFLKPEFLSTEVKSLHTEMKGDIELASDKEKYFALKSKVLSKLGKHEACIEICDIALNLFQEFHYNNDLWFKMRKAICYEKVGEKVQAEKLFDEILSTKAGYDKWFLYSALAEHYFDNEEYLKAWECSVNAAYYGNEPQYLINLYLLQARILFRLDRKDDGLILANLLAAILKEFEYTVKPEYANLIKYYNVAEDELSSVKEYFRKAKEFWGAERYSGKNRERGQVVAVDGSGKKGKIKTLSGITFNFSKRDFRKMVRDLKEVLKSNVEFFPMKDFKDDNIAEDIVVLNSTKPTYEPKAEKPTHGKVKIISSHKSKKVEDAIVGKTYNGVVSSIKEFGIFITMPEKMYGLIHKNSNSLPQNFQEVYSIGESVNVEIIEVTSKGISFKQIK